jgi:hypothetical protein
LCIARSPTDAALLFFLQSPPIAHSLVHGSRHTVILCRKDFFFFFFACLVHLTNPIVLSPFRSFLPQKKGG